MKLPPSVPKVIEDSLSHERIAPLLAQAAAPCAISYPAVAAARAVHLQQAVQPYGVPVRFFGAHKATNSVDLIAATCTAGFGCDIASLAELATAQQAGFNADDIIATGPKSTRLLQQLVQQPDIAIVLDSYEELQRLAAIDAAKNPVLLRMSRSMTNQPGITKLSRFGMDEAAFTKSVEYLQQQTSLRLRGVAFHLDSQSVEERRYAIEVGVTRLLSLQDKGFDADVLDIGGGLGSDYGVSKDAAQRFTQYLLEDTASQRRQATWQGQNYGLTLQQGVVQNILQGIDMSSGSSGADRLKEVLESPYEDGTIADALRDNLIELWCEPGSSLYFDAGVVAAEVIETYERDGHWFVVVDIHRNQLCFESNEAPADPLLYSAVKEPSQGSYVLLGNLCAETDILHQRFIDLPFHPQPGDVIVWTHTGAYRAHFSASQAIGQPLAAKYTYNDGEFYAV